MTLLRVFAPACAALVVVLLAGCREKPVRTYVVAKEKPAPAAPAPGGEKSPTGDLPPGHPPIGGPAASSPQSGDSPALPPGHPPIGPGAMPALPAMGAPAGAVANSITWAAPDHWVAKPLGAMRRGSFTVKGDGGDADLSIIVLGAATNPLLDNVNRWRGQVGLAPLPAAGLAAETETIDQGGFKFTVVDLLGKRPGSDKPVRVLGAVLYRGPEAWFFKLTGPDAVASAEKPAFLAFLRTVRAAD